MMKHRIGEGCDEFWTACAAGRLRICWRYCAISQATELV